METTCIDIPILRVLLVQIRVAAMLVSNLPLLIIGDYYYYSHNKMMKRKWRPGKDMAWDIGGCNNLCPTANGA